MKLKKKSKKDRAVLRAHYREQDFKTKLFIAFRIIVRKVEWNRHGKKYKQPEIKERVLIFNPLFFAIIPVLVIYVIFYAIFDEIKMSIQDFISLSKWN